MERFETLSLFRVEKLLCFAGATEKIARRCLSYVKLIKQAANWKRNWSAARMSSCNEVVELKSKTGANKCEGKK